MKASGQRAGEGIRPCVENPFYWQYRGKPIVLIGGSDDDNLFQWAGDRSRLVAHLDLLKSVGGNYVRNTMNSRWAAFPYRDDGMAYPFWRRDDGKYDLDRWDDAYWNRLEIFLNETHRRGIIVQLELWDVGAIIGTEAWEKQPWNPYNNINYTYENTHLTAGERGWFDQPLFLSIPALNDDGKILTYQRNYIRKMLQVSLAYDHVLYQIDNESPLPFEASDYWAAFIHEEAGEREVYVCDSRRFRPPSPVFEDFCDPDNPEHSHPLDRPQLYNFTDISQNGGNGGQTHYDNLMWFHSRLQTAPRPINHTKIYQFDWPTGKDWQHRTEGGPENGARKFWRTVFGGAASARHHRRNPEEGAVWTGLGLTPCGQTQLRGMRMLLDAMWIFTMAPCNHLLRDRSDDEAYALAEPGRQYAVYFTGEGDRSVEVDLSEMKGIATKRWLDIKHGEWLNETTLRGAEPRRLSTPGPGQWAVLIRRAQTAVPVNPHASPAARRVLHYFYSLTDRAEKRIVSGQFLDHGTQASLDEVAEAHDKTGKWVGMIGGDYYGRDDPPDTTDSSWSQDANWKETNPILIDYWKQGGLVTLCLHPFNPQSGKSAWIKKNGDTINLSDVITPGRPGHSVWMRQLDLIAEALRELKDEGVAVLFRPFHEMTGSWFWWGSMNTREEFASLWKHMFDYFTYIKGLDNLLWYYSPSATMGGAMDLYPGDEYVDLVGPDYYGRKDFGPLIAEGALRQAYVDLVATGKPFGLGEFGPYHGINFLDDPPADYDYGQFIREIKEHLPLCTSFLVWHQYYGLQFQKNAKQCLEHPWTVNREDLPAF